MRVQHLQLLLACVKLLPPVSDALRPGAIDHSLYDGGAGVLEDQHTAGVLVFSDHVIDRFDQRRHIERFYQRERLHKRFEQLVLDRFQQREAVAVMRIKRRAVQLRQSADLLDRDFVHAFFLQQRQERLLERALRITDSRIGFSGHGVPHHKLFTEMHNASAPCVGFLSRGGRLTVVCRRRKKYTIPVKDNQHLSFLFPMEVDHYV